MTNEEHLVEKSEAPLKSIKTHLALDIPLGDYFRSLPRSVSLLGATATTLLIMKAVWFDYIPEPIVGMAKLGLIVDGLLASILASIVFYFLIVHVKEIREKRLIRPFVARWVNIVLGSMRLFLNEAAKKSSVSLNFSTSSKEHIIEAFKNINPNTDAPLLKPGMPIIYESWLGYLSYTVRRASYAIGKLQTQNLLLDAQLAALLARIDSANLAQMAVSLPSKVKNEDLTAWASSFYTYLQIFRELEEYRKTAGLKFDHSE